MKYNYEKLSENGKIKTCPLNDVDGSVTGRIVFGVSNWFDENPEERKRLGWIKHILADEKAIVYNKQTQYLQKTTRQVDEWTVEDQLQVVDKDEDMLLMEEMLDTMGVWGDFNMNQYDDDDKPGIIFTAGG